MSTRRSPHSILGVEPGASPDEIRAARRRLARAHHPDRFAGDPAGARGATREMALINAAAQALLGEALATQPPAPTAPIKGGHRAERPVTGRVTVDGGMQTNARTSTPTSVRWRTPAPSNVSHTRSPEPLVGSPAGPVQRRIDPEHVNRPRPSLDVARNLRVTFGRYAGGTIAQIARLDPGYLAWCVDNVRRDADLVAAANVMLDELARTGRYRRPPRGSLFRPSPNAYGATLGEDEDA
ncbi:MAG: DnaJ domain-containing protein [Candidatus Limnocylindrus sp.]